MDGETITTGELARRVGVREVQLQTLIRQGVIDSPPIVGRFRRWSASDVESVRAILVNRGVVLRDVVAPTATRHARGLALARRPGTFA